MSMYNLPKSDISEIKKNFSKFLRNKKVRELFGKIVFLAALACIAWSVVVVSYAYFPSQTQTFFQSFKIPEIEFFKQKEPPKVEEPVQTGYVSNITYEQAIIDAAKNVSPSVVSIVISKNLPVYEQEWVNPFGDSPSSPFYVQIPQYVQKGTEYQEVGAGSGFIVSADGLVLTNKHVVSDKAADYTVLTNDGEKYSAKVLALDPVQDLAVIKIQLSEKDSQDKKFQPVVLGDSSGVQLGQTAIAIGNALGEFRNTISVGIVSGLGRTVSASDQTGSLSETLENIIQTDAAINSGNSGGPLLNLKGEVIGINTAIATGAQSIGFALPINLAKRDIEQVSKTNKIVYPFLGVRYILVNEEIKKKYDLSVDYGAMVSKGTNGEAAVTAGSGAEKAGIKTKDIILEINGEKITQDNSMATIIQKYNAGDIVTLHILRDGTEQDISVTLGERTS